MLHKCEQFLKTVLKEEHQSDWQEQSEKKNKRDIIFISKLDPGPYVHFWISKSDCHPQAEQSRHREVTVLHFGVICIIRQAKKVFLIYCQQYLYLCYICAVI